MITRTDLTCFTCLLLAAALLGFWMPPRATPAPHQAGAADPALLHHVIFIGLTPDEEMKIKKALLRKFDGRCSEAFVTAGLRSPAQVMGETGIVFRHSKDLFIYEASVLGLTRTKLRDIYRAEFSGGRAQAGTIPGTRSGQRLTLDGKPRIFIHDSAFLGKSFLFRRLPLGDVLTHELIHAAGQPPKPDRLLGFLRHDLAGYEHYNRIMQACS